MEELEQNVEELEVQTTFNEEPLEELIDEEGSVENVYYQNEDTEQGE